MVRRIYALFVFSAITVLSYGAVLQWQTPVALKTFQTFAGLTVLYAGFRIVLQELVERRLGDEKVRYTARKSLSVLYIALFLVFALRLWVDNPETLVVAYGIVGAGVAVSLRDVFANFAGGVNLFLAKPYRVGHRVEIDGVKGDVIDTGLFYTKLLEIEGWVKGDQASGRTVTVPNGVALSEPVTNYTEDNSFIWDEIQIPLKYGTDVDEAKRIMVEAAERETSELMERAEKEMSKIRKKYYLSEKETEPRVYTELTDNWINLSLRFISDVRNRRQIYSDISEDILKGFQDEGIEVASETLDIS